MITQVQHCKGDCTALPRLLYVYCYGHVEGDVMETGCDAGTACKFLE